MLTRYVEETKRLHGVLESELSDGRKWLVRPALPCLGLAGLLYSRCAAQYAVAPAQVGGNFTLADAFCTPWAAVSAGAGGPAGTHQ